MFDITQVIVNESSTHGFDIEIDGFDLEEEMSDATGNFIFTNGEDTITIMPMFWQSGSIAFAIVYSEIDGDFYANTGVSKKPYSFEDGFDVKVLKKDLEKIIKGL